MLQGIKALAANIPAALVGRIVVFINDAGRLATKDESGVVTVYGTGSGGATNTPRRLLTNTTYTVPDYSQVLYAKPIIFGAGAILKFGPESMLVQVN